MKNYVLAMLFLVLLSANAFAALNASITSVTILNKTDNATITGNLYISDGLVCQVIASDNFDPDVYQTSINTYKNGVVVNTYLFNATAKDIKLNVSNFVTTANAKKGDSWNCSANASDGALWSTRTMSTGITYNNTAPVVSSVAVTRVSNTLTCGFTYSDLDSDTRGITYYIWQKGSSVIAGQTSQTLDVSTYVKGDTFNCSVKAEDTGYSIKNSTVASSVVYTLSGTCIYGTVNSVYNVIDMCTVLKVFSDLAQFVNDMFSPLIQLMVMVIVLGAVLSLITAILYGVFKAIEGGIGGIGG